MSKPDKNEKQRMVDEGGHDVDTDSSPDESGTLQENAEKIVLEAEMVKIKIGIAVNGHNIDDIIVADRHHPLYGGLVDQHLAEVID